MDELKINEMIAEELSRRSAWRYELNVGGELYRVAAGTQRMLFLRKFTESLDSCRFFEKTLTPTELGRYCVEAERFADLSATDDLLLLDSAQRCEMFLRMLGKWESE